jgi:hypothetical protein
MSKRLTLALSTAALVATMLPGAASAAPPAHAREHLPEGGCPSGWLAGQPQHGGQVVDWNGDTWACMLLVPGGGFVLIDNLIQHNR